MTTVTQLDMMMKSRHKFKHAKLAITGDNSKVLGRITDMRTEKMRESQKFSTNKMKTHNSAWTPVVNKASNEQVNKKKHIFEIHGKNDLSLTLHVKHILIRS